MTESRVKLPLKISNRMAPELVITSIGFPVPFRLLQSVPRPLGGGFNNGIQVSGKTCVSSQVRMLWLEG
jgi:hypothetical protein